MDVKADKKNRIRETRHVEKQELGLTNRDQGYLQFSENMTPKTKPWSWCDELNFKTKVK